MVSYLNDYSEFDNTKLSNTVLQLLLFVDHRNTSQRNIEDIKRYLMNLTKEFNFNLEIIEVAEHPHLLEHFKLVVTPALIKINPPPKQIIAGSDLIAQLKQWWYRWQNSSDDETQNSSTSSALQTCIPSAEYMRLSDEVFSLKREKEKLEKQLKFKDQILAMLAHDLRSPLTAASMAVETIELVQSYPNKEKASELKQKLHQQAKRQFQIMNNMITELLEASKTMRDELNVLPTELSLLSLCDEIISFLKPKLEEKKQNLIKDIPQDLPSVYADPELIRQVIVNLLENAIKFTPNNGEITISILHRTSQKIQVSILDTGPGIPNEKKELIFQNHFRLKRDKTTDGYGLGLALCQKVVNSHYGQIWVDSTIDKGSCFHFTLPVFNS